MMQRLTSRSRDGKRWVYTEKHITIISDENEEHVKGEEVYFLQYQGRHIDKLAYYEDLEDEARKVCEQCKIDGYYAEWGKCDEECGCSIFHVA